VSLCPIVLLSACWHVLVPTYPVFVPFSVMQKELDKIERFASEVTEKSKMSKASADNLLASVKVNRMCIINVHITIYGINYRNLYQGIENNFMN
jgi:hypothetical protein